MFVLNKTRMEVVHINAGMVVSNQGNLIYEDFEVYNPNGTLIYSKEFNIISQNE